MKKIFILIGIFFLFGFTIRSPKNGTERKEYTFNFVSEKELEVGEEITYVVRYWLLKLGEVKLSVLDKKFANGKYYYATKAYIDSYSSVPFVNLHQIYESKVNEKYFSDFFRGTVKGEEYSTFTEYDFDYEKEKLRVKKGKVSPYQLWNDSTTSAKKMYQDGLSIFYYARMNTGQKKSVNVPCFVKEQRVYTKINFYKEKTPMEIDAVNYEIDCVRLDGSTDFVSVYGLTGYFEGWFTNDSHAVPVIAKLNVIIGKVTVELVKWKKKNWSPPRFKS